MPKRITVCITGSSGSIYGIRLLQSLKEAQGIETHLVISKPGMLVIKQELDLTKGEVSKLASYAYDVDNFNAPIASGSFVSEGTVIAPCSMKTLSAIAMGYEDNLISRAASVSLKERRKLILMVRETPISTIHLENMLAVSKAGGIIMPPLPPLYFGTKDFDKLVDMTIGRVLTMLGIRSRLHKEWEGPKSKPDTDTA